MGEDVNAVCGFRRHCGKIQLKSKLIRIVPFTNILRVGDNLLRGSHLNYLMKSIHFGPLELQQKLRIPFKYSKAL